MLPKQNRLRTADFKKMRLPAVSAQAGGARTVHSPHFFARIQNGTNTAEANAAAVVSSAVAKKAAARNLLRRRVYAALRSHLHTLQGSLVVVTAKQGAPALSFKELQGELSALLQRI